MNSRTSIPLSFYAGDPPWAAAGAAKLPVTVPSQFPLSRPSTGTPDDDDEPEDEHEGENEAEERETVDDTEAPEEFQSDGE